MKTTNHNKKCAGKLATDLIGLKAIVFGGAILGGGGGGTYQDGLDTIDIAVRNGEPQIISIDQIDPSEYVVTVSAVGAPAANNRYLKPMDFVCSLENLIKYTSKPISGIITSEMGARASVNGLIQSAILGIPVVDAPANGRAHPLGVMGSLGLHNVDKYISIQSASGGDPHNDRKIELLVKGELEKCSQMVRDASIVAGGVVAVARNPVTKSYLEENAAIGALTKAQKLGRKIISALEKGKDTAKLAAQELGGELIVRGKISELILENHDGLDIGRVSLDTGHSFAIWNEYITADKDNKRLYTFPDLITSIESSTNMPINTCQLKQGMEISMIGVPQDRIILSSTMHEKALLKRIEQRLKIKLK